MKYMAVFLFLRPSSIEHGLDPDPAIIIDCQPVVLPGAVSPPEAALNPRQSILVDAKHSYRSPSSYQLFVEASRIAVECIAGCISIPRHPDNTNPITNAQFMPRLVH